MNFMKSQVRRRKTKWRLYLGTTPRRYLGRHRSKHDRFSSKIGLWGKEDLLDERLGEVVQTWLWRICPYQLLNPVLQLAADLCNASVMTYCEYFRALTIPYQWN